MKNRNPYEILDPAHTDSKRLKKEREKARKLKKTQWWLTKLNRGICHHCGKKFPRKDLTMDHLVPLAKGGRSNKGNLVVSCWKCNQEKGLS